jgi:putative tricarboxylic transport membrane protein
MILGLVLGPIIEPMFRRALMMQEYDVVGVITRPITAGLLIVSIIITLTPVLWKLKKHRIKEIED